MDSQVYLSPYIAKVLLRKGPKAAYDAHYKLGNAPRKPRTASLKLGLVIDRIVFKKEHDLLIHEPYKCPKDLPHYRIPCTPSMYQKAKAIADVVKPEFYKLHMHWADTEVDKSLTWTSQEGVLCKGRPDLVRNANTASRLVLDLKSCYDMTWQGRLSAITKYDYDLQLAAYSDAEPTQFTDSAILWCSTSEPYEAKLQLMDSIQIGYGMEKWRKACELWKQCLANNDWPDWTDTGAVTVKDPWSEL